MANDIFFLSWALWQQMTFVLAMAIVAVFCAGLVKLWWNNRLMRKQEVLDEEKRQRLQEMRKTGLPVKRANEIPFGVRAIQSGVEVDGIWISRPASPSIDTSKAKLASSTTLVGLSDSESQRKEKHVSDDTKSLSTSTVNLDRAAPRQSPSDGSIFQRLTDADDSTNTTPSGTPPVSVFAPQRKRHDPRAVSVLNEDTLRRLEGQVQTSRPAAYETYVPTSAPRNPRRPSQRSSASSSGESMDSQPRSVRSASGRSYASSRSSKLYTSRNTYETRPDYHGAVPQALQERDPRDPFATPARTPSGFSAFSQSDTRSSLYHHQELSMPEPTFGPGDLHLNKSSRKVNDGFEVLPAGTFGGVPHEFRGSAGMPELDNVEELGQGGHIPKSAKKLRKKSLSQLPQDGQGYGEAY
ncbi:hypothetical protein QBC46DRAFT_294966 [Diplogelasinospora grovesii]|uniref:Uncharacterized protein n=1 Tax=Diplogelasinospora grovesii TaxID=303347 RepID=A0AAN6N2N2_9PEZI|nr:hypothetical protein QBC46DRAFT_294966 [Diplogelasinospora grovesii]